MENCEILPAQTWLADTTDKDAAHHSNHAIPGYLDLMQTMPLSPPQNCMCSCDIDSDVDDNRLCTDCNTWWGAFRSMVDDLLLHSNVHTCQQGRKLMHERAKDRHKKLNTVKGCLNKDSVCMA